MPKESAYFMIENLSDKKDVERIKRELDTLPGVFSVSICPEHHRVAVDFDNTGTKHSRIEKKLDDLGYRITADSGEEHIM